MEDGGRGWRMGGGGGGMDVSSKWQVRGSCSVRDGEIRLVQLIIDYI